MKYQVLFFSLKKKYSAEVIGALAQNTTAADDIHEYFFIVFQRKC